MSPDLSFISFVLCGWKASEETGASTLPTFPSCEGCWAHLSGPGRNLLSSCIRLYTHPQGNTWTYFSREKYSTVLPFFPNHCAFSVLLKVSGAVPWAAGIFRGQWTQLINDLMGRQIKSFWVEKFQFNHVFNLVLKQRDFFSTPSALPGFDSIPKPLSSSVTLPMAQQCAEKRNSWSHITTPCPQVQECGNPPGRSTGPTKFHPWHARSWLQALGGLCLARVSWKDPPRGLCSHYVNEAKFCSPIGCLCPIFGIASTIGKWVLSLLPCFWCFGVLPLYCVVFLGIVSILFLIEVIFLFRHSTISTPFSVLHLPWNQGT